MLLALFITAAIALTVPGFVLAVRALPPVAKLVAAGVKPWACDICMSFWGTALFTLVAEAWTRDPRFLACAGPAYTLALAALSHLERPPVHIPAGLLGDGLADKLEPPQESP